MSESRFSFVMHAVLLALAGALLGSGTRGVWAQPNASTAPDARSASVLRTSSASKRVDRAFSPAGNAVPGLDARPLGADSVEERVASVQVRRRGVRPINPQNRPGPTVEPTGLPTPAEQWRDLWGEASSPASLFGVLGPALGDHLEDTPASWRDDALGYAARAGSNLGGLLVEVGATHGLAASMRLDLRFRRRGAGDVGPRIRHAALEAVTAQTAGGRRVPNVPRVLGTYASTLAQQRWEHGDLRPGEAALSTAVSLGIDVAVNVVREFAGDK